MASGIIVYSFLSNSVSSDISSCACVIEDLVRKPFNSRQFSEKLRIKDKGRPTPELPGLSAKYKDRTREYTRHFTVANYDKYKWLTGCAKLNKLFCWPCLLFSSEKTSWSSGGFSKIGTLSHSIGRHEKSKAHIACAYALCTFGNSGVDLQLNARKSSLQVSQHNATVKKNRAILVRLIDVICFLGKQELPFRGHDESETSLNKGNYIETLKLVGGYDYMLNDHLSKATDFRGTAASTQNDLIESVSSVMLDAIKKEVSGTLFVSILIDECSDVVTKSQLSTSLRYVDKSGEVQERFIGFTDVSADRSADALCNHVVSIAEQFDLRAKVVAQTYDGAVVMPDKISGLQAKVREKFPEALFVHCNSHDLNLVLQQAVTCIKECRFFFQALSGVAKFFSKSTRRTESLCSFVHKIWPEIAPSCWNFTSRLVNTVHEFRSNLVIFFERIIDPENSPDWDPETVMLARGCLSFLTQFETIFLLQVFWTIFSHVDILFDVLQNRTMDTEYCYEKVTETKQIFREFRETGFQNLWKATSEELEEGEQSERKRRRYGESPEAMYKRLFREILDNVIDQINDRFSNLQAFEFFSLLDTDKFQNHKRYFPDTLLSKLMENYSSCFDTVGLKNELTVLYSSQECALMGKEVHEIVSIMNQNDLIWAMPEIYKLACLVMTIPSTTASVERSFSVFERLKSYCQSTQGQEIVSGLAIMSVEKKLLHKLRNSVNVHTNFNDAVIELFIGKTKRDDLNFK